MSCLLNLKVWLISCAMLLGLAQPAAANPFDEAVAAYRAGDLVSSAALFEGLLDDVESRTARGPIFYNLGNIHFRQGEFMRAVAAYTAAVEAMPRSQTAWDNLELARSRAGLDPADKGDFAATVKRLVMVLSPAELAWIGWGLIGLLAIGLLVEMLRGGPGLRALIGVVLVLIAFDLAWMDVASARLSAAPAMVVSGGAVPLYAEPNVDYALGLKVSAGERVRVVDRLGAPGVRGAWVKVAGEEGTGWIKDSDLVSWSMRSL